MIASQGAASIERDVLVRGGVEHILRLEVSHERVDACLVADVGDLRRQPRLRMPLPELVFEQIQAVLVDVDGDELADLRVEQLPADLAADRAAGAGDEHAAAAHRRASVSAKMTGSRGSRSSGERSLQQVGRAVVLKVDVRDRQDLDLHLEAGAEREQLAHLAGVEPGNGDQHVSDAMALDDLPAGSEAAQHRFARR